MATTLYLTTDDFHEGTFAGLFADPGFWDGTTAGYGSEGVGTGGLSTSRSPSSLFSTINTVAGPTAGLCGPCFVSLPLDAGVTISGTITFNLWALESNMSANATVKCRVYKCAPDGTLTQISNGDSSFGTELTLSAAAKNWTHTPTSTVCNKGDRLVVFAGLDDATALTMGTGYNASIDYGAGSAGVDGDSYVTFTETLTFDSSTPAGTKYYLRNTASDVEVGVTEKALSTTAGASVSAAVRNTIAGPMSPTQWTDTAGGTAIEWYTPTLSAFTLGSKVLVTLWGKANDVNVKQSIVAEIAVVNGDGSSPTIWSKQLVGHLTDQSTCALMTTTISRRQAYLNGADLSVSAGQRVRLRLYIAENYETVGFFPSVGGKTVTIDYDGATADADGDSFITFSQTVTEGGGGGPTVDPYPFVGGGFYPSEG